MTGRMIGLLETNRKGAAVGKKMVGLDLNMLTSHVKMASRDLKSWDKSC